MGVHFAVHPDVALGDFVAFADHHEASGCSVAAAGFVVSWLEVLALQHALQPDEMDGGQYPDYVHSWCHGLAP